MKYKLKYIDCAGEVQKYEFNFWYDAMDFIGKICINNQYAFKLTCKKA